MKVSRRYSFGDYSVSLEIEFDPGVFAEDCTAFSILKDFTEANKNANTEPSVE